MMLSSIVLYFLLTLEHISALKLNITIFAISNTDATLGLSVVGGEWLALLEIMNNSEILPGYSLNFEVYNVHGDSQLAVIQALDIINKDSTENNTHLPIILGAPWSSLSSSTALVLGAYNMGQISSSATSIALSDTNKYPYFYRTIVSDVLQANGLIILCNTFNWTSIGIVYVNDAYGLYLSIGLQELAKLHGIKAVSISISYESDTTYYDAAQQIKDLGLYIIILVVHSTAHLFSAFEEEQITGYPYFYLGVDGWFDRITIHEWNAPVQGSIGMTPWQPDSLDLNEYDEDIRNIVNISLNKVQNLNAKWSYYYNNGYSEQLNVESPGIYSIYGYDSMYTLVYAIAIAMQQTGNTLNEFLRQNNSQMIHILNDIITNKIDFIGATGHVIFDEIGNRRDGLLGFGNVMQNADIEYFGYLYQKENGNISFKLNKSKIIWPSDFIEKGMLPRSNVLIHKQIITIHKSVSIVMCILFGISLFVSLGLMTCMICFHNNKAIKSSSLELNVIMCIGASLGYMSCILYGMDEEISSFKILNGVCKLRYWIIIISWTLLFMPLFFKTYRLSRLFKSILKNKMIIKDKSLFIAIFICVCVDILLLVTLTLIRPSNRIYIS
eukprot:307696_1